MRRIAPRVGGAPRTVQDLMRLLGESGIAGRLGQIALPGFLAPAPAAAVGVDVPAAAVGVPANGRAKRGRTNTTQEQPPEKKPRI